MRSSVDAPAADGVWIVGGFGLKRNDSTQKVSYRGMVRPVVALALLVVSTLGACAMDGSSGIAVTAPIAAAVPAAGPDEVRAPHAGMLRFPDVGKTHIAFVYANDIWLVPRGGGVATPIASPLGQERFPRFSADDERIAFVGNYDGDTDLYTLPVAGGIPMRVTHHPSNETLCGWTPGGDLIFFTNGFGGLPRQQQLFTVSASGGLPKKMPVPYGANGAISPDGQWLAYTPHSRDHRTWKRYKGGMATDIWLFNLSDHSSKKITDWDGTDSQPMWHGNRVYYLSDAGPDHRLNIWSYDTGSGQREQITRMPEFDVKWPAIGPGAGGAGEIVFSCGPDLMLLELATKQVRAVAVSIPGATPRLRPKLVNASKFIQARNISATGKRVVVGARGDIWSLPSEHGSPRNLTATSGVAERDPMWSPDGQWIAYFSDASSEYDLYVVQSDGKGEPRKLSSEGDGYLYSPVWSPDSKRIAYQDKAGAMFLCVTESGETKQIDRDPWGRFGTVSWSSDSNWIAYAKGGDNYQSSIWLYNVEKDAAQQVTAGMFADSDPTFDRKGEFLYFVSAREFSSPMYEDVGNSFIYARSERLYAVPLRADVELPWAPKSDEEKWGDDKDEEDDEEDDEKDEGDNGDNGEEEDSDDDASDAAEDEDEDEDEDESDTKKDEKDKKKEPEPVKIDLDGFERRAIQVPVDRGNFRSLGVNNKGHLVYGRRPPRGADGKPSIMILDPEDEKKEEKTVVEGVGSFSISGDGKKLLVVKKGKMSVIDAKADQKLEKTVSTDGMNVLVEPRAEWRQVFTEAWRIERDFFYDANMHGVDWNAKRKQYERMLEDCASREDVQFVIGELIAELNVGHAYARSSGGGDDAPKVSVGMLGCDFTLDSGAYRIAKIHEGGVWDVSARGPLSQPDAKVKEGDYLLAVNGLTVDTTKDPWAAFLGLAGATVTITVSEKPQLDDDARDIVVELLKSEREVRFRGWIESNRAYVAEKTDGKVGYIYVTNTSINGQNDLFRQFYGQRDMAALIIDERWNGGGQIPTRFVELLNRPVANYWARRDGMDWMWPPDSHQGPKCMLINGLAGSGGDYFPWWFREAGVGPLIGMRTWGGLVGMSGNPRLIDGGAITAPTFGFYETDGTWGIEGHGVEPDHEVVDDPALMVDGGDPQLDKAIELMLGEIERRPFVRPQRPAYPNRSGMGIPDEDK